MKKNCKIIKATQKDIPSILEFIRALAVYEKLESEVVVTEELLLKNLFGERPCAEVIFYEADSIKVGFALFFNNFSTFLGLPGIYLEDLFVKPEFRGEGYGKELLIHLASLTIERGCGRLEWSVLDWNKPALDFYASINAVPMSEWTAQRLTGNSLRVLAESKKC
ncbi:MAG: GNAT family N-acetyltransferase [Bacteriovorax sp.]|nr:GNAT family N-acetyltransferase [Bacteriovorax sp.]